MSELKTKYLKLEQDELSLLSTLLRLSKDDPRIHGLIGTCFWSHAHSKKEEAELKQAWTRLQDKVASLVEEKKDVSV